MTNEERQRVAHHEAGHAVLDSVSGGLVVRVTIRPDDERGTSGTTRAEEGVWSSEEAERQILVLYAGYAADVEWAPAATEEAKLGASDDDERAADYMSWLDGHTPALERRLRAQAESLVREHWPSIQRVATELVARETINGDELDLLIAIARGEATEVDLARYRQLAGRE